MERNARPNIWRRLTWAFKVAKAQLAEESGDFARAWTLLDEAEQIWPLRLKHRVQRARLLLRMQRMEDANKIILALRNELKGLEQPDQKYLRHYCTYMLSSMMGSSSGQWAYEAEQAKQLPCSPALKRDFPMTTIDDIHDAVPPKPRGPR